jgi:hypothetical protein
MSLVPFQVLGGFRRVSAMAVAIGGQKKEEHALSTSSNYHKG